MRLLDLIDLFAGDGEAPVDLDQPLVLPGALSTADQGEVIALVRARSAREPPRMLDLRWDRGLTEPARRAAVAAVAETAGSEALLVLRASAGTHVDDVLRDDVVLRHRRVVVALDYPGGAEPLAPVRELVRRTIERADPAQRRLAASMKLDPRAWRALRGHATGLSNPVAVAVLCDAALSLHLEGLSGDTLTRVALQRVIARELAWRSDAEVAALVSVAEQGPERAARDHPDAMASLRTQMLVRDGRLLDWAALLHDPALAEEALDALAQARPNAPPPLRDVLWRRRQRGRTLDRDLLRANLLVNRGEYAEAQRLLDARVGIGAEAPFLPQERWMAWVARGALARGLQRYEEATRALETAAELVADLGAHEQGLVEREIGRTFLEANDPASAVLHLTRALEHYRASDEDGFHLALVAHELGLACLELGRFDEAELHLRVALDGRTRAGDKPIGRWLSLRALTTALQKQGRIAEAVALAPDMRALLDELPDDLSRGRAWHHLGRVYAKAGCHKEAADAFERALTLGRVSDTDAETAGSATQLGRALAHLGANGRALAAFDEALSLATRAALEPKAIAEIQADRGTILERLGRLDDAIVATREALSAVTPSPGVAPLAIQANDLGMALAHAGRWEGAREMFSMAYEHLRAMPGEGLNAARSAYNLAFALQRLRPGTPEAAAAAAAAASMVAALERPPADMLEGVTALHPPRDDASALPA